MSQTNDPDKNPPNENLPKLTDSKYYSPEDVALFRMFCIIVGPTEEYWFFRKRSNKGYEIGVGDNIVDEKDPSNNPKSEVRKNKVKDMTNFYQNKENEILDKSYFA